MFFEILNAYIVCTQATHVWNVIIFDGKNFFPSTLLFETDRLFGKKNK